VIEGAKGADRVDRGIFGGNVSVAPAVLALRVAIGRVGALNRS